MTKSLELEFTHADAVLHQAQAAAAMLDGVEILASTEYGVRLRVVSLQQMTRYWRAYGQSAFTARSEAQNECGERKKEFVHTEGNTTAPKDKV